jgi:GntR family transcriptional regulator
MTVVENEDVPVYLKLRGYLAAMIIEGRYAECGQLPSVRAFAAKHSVNPLTIAKAYQCLQDEGYVVVKRGIGMFVAEGATERLRINERRLFLEHVWPRMSKHIERLGISLDELISHE